MPTWALALGRLQQRRLAEEEVGVARDLGEAAVRPGVARVPEDGAVFGDAEPECQQGVVEDSMRDDVEAARDERLPGRVLAQEERGLKHVRLAELSPEATEGLRAAGGDPQLRRRRSRRRPELEPPDPRHEVAPVVEVEVRDRDRVDLRPALE